MTDFEHTERCFCRRTDVGEFTRTATYDMISKCLGFFTECVLLLINKRKRNNGV